MANDILSVAKFERFLAGFENSLVYIGLDVHKQSWRVALLRPDGELTDLTMPPEPTTLIQMLQSLPVMVGMFAQEAEPTGYGLARALQSAGLPITVAAPSRIPRPVAPTHKTDRLDCRKLAEFAASGLLRPIAIPSEHEEAFRTLVRHRHQLTDGLRRCKQRMRGLLLSNSAIEPEHLDHWSKAAIEQLHQLELAAATRQTLNSHLREWAFLTEEQQSIDKQIKAQAITCGQQNRIERLKTADGVGHVVAATCAAELFHPERFSRSEQVTAYQGLAPMVRESGGKHDRGHLRPVGQQRLRSLLIEAAWI
ncbi:IS110 family transposase [Magnetococcus sp. PR-3]|uniref:IS110 family transposase n=1 Tax=Magnetococcus sp. PR-3 TaxID=3120355 RepID=UPI002FCDF5CC